jgi:hypothetical protein
MNDRAEPPDRDRIDDVLATILVMISDRRPSEV